MNDNKKYVLVWHALLYVGLSCLAMVIAALMTKTCKAQTVTKDWTLTEPREALVVGFKVDNYLFELSFEYREAYEKEDVSYETFAVPMAFSYLHDMKYGDFTLSFGGGVGFMLQIEWAGTQYNLFGNEITYPEVNTETWFFLQTYVSLTYDVFIITYHVKISDDWIHPSFGIGFTW